MKFEFKLVYDTDNDRDANALGEAFRNEFFNQDKGEFGCYSTFELRQGVFGERKQKETFDEDDEWRIEVEWTIAHKYIDNKFVTMRYYWDGDGYLSFDLPNGLTLANSDCKKNHGWYFQGEGA